MVFSSGWLIVSPPPDVITMTLLYWFPYELQIEIFLARYAQSSCEGRLSVLSSGGRYDWTCAAGLILATFSDACRIRLVVESRRLPNFSHRIHSSTLRI